MSPRMKLDSFILLLLTTSSLKSCIAEDGWHKVHSMDDSRYVRTSRPVFLGLPVIKRRDVNPVLYGRPEGETQLWELPFFGGDEDNQQSRCFCKQLDTARDSYVSEQGENERDAGTRTQGQLYYASHSNQTSPSLKSQPMRRIFLGMPIFSRRRRDVVDQEEQNERREANENIVLVGESEAQDFQETESNDQSLQAERNDNGEYETGQMFRILDETTEDNQAQVVNRSPDPGKGVFIGLPSLTGRRVRGNNGRRVQGNSGRRVHGNSQSSTSGKDVFMGLPTFGTKKSDGKARSPSPGKGVFIGLPSYSGKRSDDEIRSPSPGKGVFMGLPSFSGKKSDDEIRSPSPGKGVFMGLPSFSGKKSDDEIRSPSSGKGVFMGLPSFGGKKSDDEIRSPSPGKGVFMGLPSFSGKKSDNEIRSSNPGNGIFMGLPTYSG